MSVLFAHQKRDSIGTLILTDDENTGGLAKPIDTDEIPSFLQEDSEAYLKYMSPPPTTKVYKVRFRGGYELAATEYSRR